MKLNKNIGQNLKRVEVAPYWNVNLLKIFGNTDTSSVEVAPYWNVNGNIAGFMACCYSVEVAPYWNVNKDNQYQLHTTYLVEVAPYWNVNVWYLGKSIQFLSRRSSSILECKISV